MADEFTNLDEDVVDLDEDIVDLDEDIVDLDEEPSFMSKGIDAVGQWLEEQKIEQDSGPGVKEAFYTFAVGAKKAEDTIVAGAKDLWPEVEPLTRALDPLKDPFKATFNAVGAGIDVINRGVGTPVATVADAFLNPSMNPEAFSFRNQAQKRIDADRAAGNPGEYPMLDNILPVRLAEDVAYPIGKGAFNAIADLMRKPGVQTLDDLAYVVDGFAPGAGMVASFIAAANLPLPKIGALTKMGVEAEKIGALSMGKPLQMFKGERGLIGAEVGGFLLPRKEVFNVGGKQFAKAYDKINNSVIKAEVANLYIPFTRIEIPNPVRIAGKALSKVSHEGVNLMVENFNMAKNSIQYQADEMYRFMSTKANSLGVNLESPEVRKRLYDAFDRPKYNQLSGQEKALFDYLDGSLRAEVELTRAKGIPIADKVFGMADDVSEGFSLSETYVPRGTTLSKKQELMAKKKLKSFDDVELYIQSLEGRGGGGSTGSFQRSRSEMTRDSMNKYMKEKYDIDDFFHDDIVAAYSDKIADLRSSRAEKEFFDNLMGAFGRSESQYIQIIRDARNRVREVRANGGVPSGDDVFLAALEPRGLGNMTLLPEPVRKRLAKIGALSDKGELKYSGKSGDNVVLQRVKGQDMWDVENLRLPEEIADYVSDVLYRPKLAPVEQSLMAFQNAMKGFMFFNPGYHIRNFAESYSRAIGYGAGHMEHAKASAAMFKNKGAYKGFLSEFKSLSPGLSNFSMAEEVTGLMSVPRSYLSEQNASKVLGSSLKEIVSKGKWGEFISDLKAGKANIRENPLFKFSSEVGSQGENLSKFAVFSKLREEGYSSVEAMRKVNRIFPDYQITRSGVRKAQLVAPFANYFIKNAETTLKILSEAPRGAGVMGQQGALQRSFENWAGFDPERTYKYKELFGDWADDYIFINIMPGADAIDENPDYVRELLRYMGDGLESGEVIWMRLPSNNHALKQLDPRALHENWGPLVRATSALIGRDPFTGSPLIGQGTSKEGPEERAAAIKELTGPMAPQTAVPAVQALMNKQFGEWSDKLLNAGLPEGAVEVIFGSKLEANQKRAKKALMKAKLLWTGGATQLDLQAVFGAAAKMKSAKKYVKDNVLLNIKGKRDEKVVITAYDALDDAYKTIVEMFVANNEFQLAIDRAGGTPDMSFQYAMDDALAETPVPSEEAIPSDDNDLNEAEMDGLESSGELVPLEEPSREPQGSLDMQTDNPLLDAGSTATKRTMFPKAAESLARAQADIETVPVGDEAGYMMDSIPDTTDWVPLDETVQDLDRAPSSDPVEQAISQVRDMEAEQQILEAADLSTPGGAQKAFDSLVQFFEKRIEQQFKNKSPEFKQDLLETIKKDFFDANRLAPQPKDPSRAIASEEGKK